MSNETLLNWITRERERLRPHFPVTEDRWNNLVNRLGAQINAPRSDYYDEVVWTYLLCVAYAAGGDAGIKDLETKLSGFPDDVTGSPLLWLEALPIPPRKSEGNTNLDLSLGAIGTREGKDGGIKFDPALGDSVVFCEMKWYSDISKSVTNDQHRNQLSRVIENAVTFQRRVDPEISCFPKKVTVTLVTPAIFVGTSPKSRLYHYKLEEYRKFPHKLLEEWKQSYRLMKKRNQFDWVYPEEERLHKMLHTGLKLKHLSFEELFSGAPSSDVSPLIRDFISSHNGSATRFATQ